MFHKTIRLIGVLSLTLLGIALGGQPASAQQQGWPYVQQNRWWEGGSGGAFQNVTPAFSPSAVLAQAPAPASTQIQLEVPASAKVWFDGRPTTQSGSVRTFVVPPLATGVKYHYAVRVEWQDGGRKLERNQTITFSAGERLNLDFVPHQTVDAAH